MRNSIPDRNEDYYKPQAKLFAAEIYVQIGEKTKAVKLLTEVLIEGKESCCYEFGFLLSVGKVLEQYKIKANSEMKKILAKFIAVAEN